MPSLQPKGHPTGISAFKPDSYQFTVPHDTGSLAFILHSLLAKMRSSMVQDSSPCAKSFGQRWQSTSAPEEARHSALTLSLFISSCGDGARMLTGSVSKWRKAFLDKVVKGFEENCHFLLSMLRLGIASDGTGLAPFLSCFSRNLVSSHFFEGGGWCCNI